MKLYLLHEANLQDCEVIMEFWLYPYTFGASPWSSQEEDLSMEEPSHEEIMKYSNNRWAKAVEGTIREVSMTLDLEPPHTGINNIRILNKWFEGHPWAKFSMIVNYDWFKKWMNHLAADHAQSIDQLKQKYSIKIIGGEDVSWMKNAYNKPLVESERLTFSAQMMKIKKKTPKKK